MVSKTLTAFIILMLFFVSLQADETQLIEPVRPFVSRVVHSMESLPSERKEMLMAITDYIVEQIERGENAKLVFVCTHNSRRSHLSQVWCSTAAAYYEVPHIETYSGGTEATACNIRTVRALRRSGLSVVASTEGDNPVYLVQYSEKLPSIRAYSKVYFEEGNPSSDFAVMLCCSDADKKCPVVEGSDSRFALHYEDPKIADNTPKESKRYDERSLQIAREMFFVMSEVSKRIH
ncbi:protein-tyrosine-phosphatase [Rubinisphaera italica]|uniref:Protein ArsC n=1 Tax=Rubinisphaera italica TaxID=2527969 RepID=A0A5C5XN62_9PLAN|nr:protein-tyrosine-phosphatase [Rubinisphaera italica]TWT63803.1 Protein ArsC [Rubinisphaera italica]